MSETLLEKLKTKQGNLSDSNFAKSLKTSQQLWQATRAGKRKIGSTIIRGFAPLYPDLALEVLAFYGFNVKEVTALLTNHTDAHETSPEPKMRPFWQRVRELLQEVGK